jgi:hypothetical protein
VDDAEARLYVRDGLHSAPSLVSRDRWRFALASGDEVRGDPRHLWVEGGIRAGRIYDLVYRAASCPVAGAGLLTVRDLAAYVRSDRPDNPLNGSVDRVLLTGVSQTSRFIRHLLYLGLDLDESGARAVDGVLGLVGGARRGEFNHRGRSRRCSRRRASGTNSRSPTRRRTTHAPHAVTVFSSGSRSMVNRRS